MIFLSEGRLSTVEIGGAPLSVRPFMGAVYGSAPAEMCIGFHLAGKLSGEDTPVIRHYSVAGPCEIIHAWRAMQLLEQIKSLGRSTLKDCLTITLPITREGQEAYQGIAYHVGGKHNLIGILKEVNVLLPPAELLDYMIEVLLAHDIEIDTGEIDAEIEAGRLMTSPAIETAKQENPLQDHYYQKLEVPEHQLFVPQEVAKRSRLSVFGNVLWLFQPKPKP